MPDHRHSGERGINANVLGGHVAVAAGYLSESFGLSFGDTTSNKATISRVRGQISSKLLQLKLGALSFY